MSQQASYTVLNNKIPKLVTTASLTITTPMLLRPLNGGEVLLKSTNLFSVQPQTRIIKLRSFEALFFKPSTSSSNSLVHGTGFHLVVTYRPQGPYSHFLEEFGEFLAALLTRSDKILIIGDFNIHLNKPSGTS